MSDGMRKELVYLSSHATNRYFIPNWGNCLYICDALLNYQGAFLPQCLWLTPMRRGRASYENTTYNGMVRGRCRASKFKQL